MILVESDMSGEWDSRTGWAALAERGVKAAVAHSRSAGLIAGGPAIEVSVRFASDEEVRALNARYRGKDQPTNVLSFPMAAPEELNRGAGELLLGDIVLAHGLCAAEAADKHVPVEDHAAHLVVHGTLHLLGYDHETEDEGAEEMEAVEREALAALGIPDPYRAREAQS